MPRLNKLYDSFSSFKKNEDGNVLIMTAVVSMVLAAAVGVGVDTAEIYRNKVNFQNALDAGTVFATKVFAESGDKNKAEIAGRRVFNANMKNTSETFKQFSITTTAEDCSGGKIVGNGQMRHPIYFAKVYRYFGGDQESGAGTASGQVTLNAETEVSCSNSTVELAMVLDVSNSMKGTPKGGSERKIDSLQTAATNLVNKLHIAFDAHPNPDALKISVVPFAGMVNIGKQYKDEDWIDTKGRASYHHEDLGWSSEEGQTQLADGSWEDTASGGQLTRFTIFDQLDVDWAGCVIHRPYPYNVTDEAPGIVDPETLFVPAFAPDTPDKLNGKRTTDTDIKIKKEENYSNNYISDFNNSSDGMTEDNTGIDNQWKRLAWPAKYFKDSSGNPPDIDNSKDKQELKGPNHYCVVQPLVPLTSDQTTVTNLLGGLTMGFGTEVHQGVLWGWRTLSAGAPFQQGRSYNAAYNKKIMVVMSDGANYMGDSKTGNRSAYPGSQYFAHGLTKNGRIWEGTTLPSSTAHTNANFRIAMDDLQKQTCDNAKAAGITIYTIAFAIKEGSSKADTMEYCASRDATGKSLYMTADDGDELFAAFEKIATDMGDITVIK